MVGEECRDQTPEGGVGSLAGQEQVGAVPFEALKLTGFPLKETPTEWSDEEPLHSAMRD